jgi:spermidine/putrescine transport system permease protein
MARPSFQVARLPGFSTVAMLAFLALYIPILTLVVYSFNSQISMGNGAGFPGCGMKRPGPTTRSRTPRCAR